MKIHKYPCLLVFLSFKGMKDFTLLKRYIYKKTNLTRLTFKQILLLKVMLMQG